MGLRQACFPLLVVAFSILTGGCAKPGEMELKRAVQDAASPTFRLVSVKKTNGADFEALGRKGYRLDYNAQFEVLAGCLHRAGDTFNCTPYTYASEQEADYYAESEGGVHRKKGTVFSHSGRVVFGKTESGWEAVIVK